MPSASSRTVCTKDILSTFRFTFSVSYKMIVRTESSCCRIWFRGLHSTRPQNSSSGTTWVRLPYPYYVTTGTISSPTGGHLSSRFVTAFTEAQNTLAFRMRLGMHWPLAEFWEDKLKKPMRFVHDFINPIVAQAIKRKRDAEADSRGMEKDRDDEISGEFGQFHRGSDNPPG